MITPMEKRSMMRSSVETHCLGIGAWASSLASEDLRFCM